MNEELPSLPYKDAAPESLDDSDELERAFDEDFATWGPAQQATGVDGAIHAVATKDATAHEVIRTANCGTGRGALTFLCLPREMLLRILSLVSATGLTSCACASKSLNSLASDDTLWRRLYTARWGKPGQGARPHTQWKRAYLDADSEEWEATRSRGGDDPVVGAIFLDMLRAKRDTPPDRRLLDTALQADPGDIAAKVAAWRRSRGFDIAGGDGPSGSGQQPQPALRPDLSRSGRAALTFTRVNPGEQPPVYACDQTGWVHVCGDACTEGVVDSRSELLVCPVSGQTTDRMVHECEEEEDGDGGRCGGGGTAGEEDAGLGVFGGGFGSFFVAGYECENERALNKLLGYKAL